MVHSPLPEDVWPRVLVRPQTVIEAEASPPPLAVPAQRMVPAWWLVGVVVIWLLREVSR